MRLVTIPFSHYCEKARWALDHAGVAYQEDGHIPMLHWRASLGVGGGRTVPVLVTDEGVLKDSTDILRFADRHAPENKKLYPAAHEAEVAALEDRFDEELGPHTRRVAYFHMLPERAQTLKLAAAHVPGWEVTILKMTYPIARGLMRRGMNINPESAERSLSKVETVWSEVDALLADGRRYLVGDRFTAADLTFAALGGVMLFPPQHPRPIAEDAVPPALLALRDRLRHTRAGEFALRIYRDHRSHCGIVTPT